MHIFIHENSVRLFFPAKLRCIDHEKISGVWGGKTMSNLEANFYNKTCTYQKSKNVASNSSLAIRRLHLWYHEVFYIIIWHSSHFFTSMTRLLDTKTENCFGWQSKLQNYQPLFLPDSFDNRGTCSAPWKSWPPRGELSLEIVGFRLPITKRGEERVTCGFAGKTTALSTASSNSCQATGLFVTNNKRMRINKWKAKHAGIFIQDKQKTTIRESCFRNANIETHAEHWWTVILWNVFTRVVQRISRFYTDPLHRLIKITGKQVISLNINRGTWY